MAPGRLRAQTVLPAVVALMAILLFAYMAVLSINLQSLRAQVRIAEERLAAVHQLQTLFKIVDYRWIPVDEYRARLQIVLENVGRFGAKIVYIAVALEDDSRWPPVWLWAEQWKAPGAAGNVPQELIVNATEWSSDGYPVVKPGGYITVTTRDPINLPVLYTNPNTTIAVYIATVYGVQVLRILGKPGCIEIDAYVDGTPATTIEARVYREGVVSWPAIIHGGDGHVTICGLAPGDYRVDATLVAPDGRSVSRRVEVHLDEGETETIFIDASTSGGGTSSTNFTASTGTTYVLHFDGVSSVLGWWGYIEEGAVAYSGGVTGLWVDPAHGLGVTCNATSDPSKACSITVYPRVAEGRYTLRIDLYVKDPCTATGCPPSLDAVAALDEGLYQLRLYVGGRLVFDSLHATPLSSTTEESYTWFTDGAAGAEVLEYNASGVECIAAVAYKPGTLTIDHDADVSIVCRGLKLTIDKGVSAVLWYNTTAAQQLYPGFVIQTSYGFAVWRLELRPDMPAVGVWTGTLAPGDTFSVNCSSKTCTISKTVEGLIAYWPFDKSTSPSIGAEPSWSLGGDVVANWVEGGVDGNGTLYLDVGSDKGGWLTATLNTPTNATLILYYRTWQAWRVVYARVLVDGVETSATIMAAGGEVPGPGLLPVPGDWLAVEAPVPAGTHNVTVALEPSFSPLITTFSLGTVQYAPAWIDHVMLVRSTYITITGLHPGDRVYIYDADTGNLIYAATAMAAAMRIPAWIIGYWRLPMHAKIVVVHG